MLEAIFEKASRQEELSRSDALKLLQLENGSAAYYLLLGLANAYSRKRFGGAGEIFAQIGLDSHACDVNCKFCSLAKDVFHESGNSEKTLDEVLSYAKQLVDAGTQELFLMTTANYDKEQFLRYAAAVKELLPAGMKLVANVGDFDLPYAKRLKESGFTGAYHVRRLREGTDTEAHPETRLQTIQNLIDAGLEFYDCVEPIGPEHSMEEILDEIFLAKEYPVAVMAAMKRIPVAGSKLYNRGKISAVELAKIVAVTTLCVRPARAMGVHEPDELCLMAGANQIYAEVGVNPRDTERSTELKRGFSIADARAMLIKAEWTVPSISQ